MSIKIIRHTHAHAHAHTHTNDNAHDVHFINQTENRNAANHSLDKLCLHFKQLSFGEFRMKCVRVV